MQMNLRGGFGRLELELDSRTWCILTSGILHARAHRFPEFGTLIYGHRIRLSITITSCKNKFKADPHRLYYYHIIISP